MATHQLRYSELSFKSYQIGKRVFKICQSYLSWCTLSFTASIVIWGKEAFRFQKRLPKWISTGPVFALFLHQLRCSRQTVCQAGGHSDGKRRRGSGGSGEVASCGGKLESVLPCLLSGGHGAIDVVRQKGTYQLGSRDLGVVLIRNRKFKIYFKLDPVGSTVRCEMTKLLTVSV